MEKGGTQKHTELNENVTKKESYFKKCDGRNEYVLYIDRCKFNILQLGPDPYWIFVAVSNINIIVENLIHTEYVHTHYFFKCGYQTLNELKISALKQQTLTEIEYVYIEFELGKRIKHT